MMSSSSHRSRAVSRAIVSRSTSVDLPLVQALHGDLEADRKHLGAVAVLGRVRALDLVEGGAHLLRASAGWSSQAMNSSITSSKTMFDSHSVSSASKIRCWRVAGGMSDAVSANGSRWLRCRDGRLPKIELHVHLDCAASYAAVARLRPEITLEQYRADFVAPAKCTNLVDFLLRPPRIVALMQDRHGIETIVDDLFDQFARDGVVYAEPRFAPHLHTEAGLEPAEVVEIVNAAVDRASADSGVAARLILCTLRHYDAATSLETAQLVERFQGSLVVALDIAGDEAGYPLDAHVEAFRYAEEHGLRRTAHAGEAAGAGQRLGDAAAAAARADRPRRPQHRGSRRWSST